MTLTTTCHHSPPALLAPASLGRLAKGDGVTPGTQTRRGNFATKRCTTGDAFLCKSLQENTISSARPPPRQGGGETGPFSFAGKLFERFRARRLAIMWGAFPRKKAEQVEQNYHK